MFGDLSTADQVQTIVVVFVVFVVAFIGLLLVSMFMPATSEQATAPYAPGELGEPGAFREPADPSYVDQLIRIRGTATVIHRPDPFELAGVDLPDLGPANPYRVKLAELVGDHYVIPVSPAPVVVAPVTGVGRHRALPELVAA